MLHAKCLALLVLFALTLTLLTSGLNSILAHGQGVVGAEYITVLYTMGVGFNKLFCKYPVFTLDLAKWLNVYVDEDLLKRVSQNCTWGDFYDVVKPLDEAFGRLNTVLKNVEYMLYKLGLRVRIVRLRCNESFCEYRLFVSLLVLKDVGRKKHSLIPEHNPVFESRPITFTVVVDRRSGRMFYQGRYVGVWVFNVDPKMLYEGSMLNLSGFVGYNGLKLVKHFPKLKRATSIPGSVKGVYKVGWVSIPVERILTAGFMLEFESWEHDECKGDLCAPNLRFNTLCREVEKATKWYRCENEWEGNLIWLRVYYDVETGFLIYAIDSGPAPVIDLFSKLIPVVDLTALPTIKVYLVKYFADIDEALKYEPLVTVPEKPIPASQIPELVEKVKEQLAKIRPELVETLENTTKTTTPTTTATTTVKTATTTKKATETPSGKTATSTTTATAASTASSAGSQPLSLFLLGFAAGITAAIAALLIAHKVRRHG